VQLDPHGEQRVVRVVEVGVIGVPQDRPGGLGPAERVHVAQPAAALLDVGFEQERHLAGPHVALAHPLGHEAQPPFGALAPLHLGLAGQLVGECAVAGEVPRLQQRGGGVEIVGRQNQGLLHRAHRVAELHASVPDRVPQPVGQGADIGAPRVEQQHVDVGLQRQLATSVAAHRHQRHAAGVAALDRRVDQLGQPVVDLAGPGRAQLAPHERVVGR
jgi:hypothetical protein